MSEFTYESGNRKEVLETYEWDNNWLEQAPDKNARRVLYIGDSISCGTRRIATEVCKGKYCFDGVGTSKAVDNPFFQNTISLFAMQEEKREVVLFNNGLHGFHMNTEEYAKHYEDMVKYLVDNFSDSRIMLLLTTYIKQEDRISVVNERNEAVIKIAEKFGLETVDLYSVSKANQDNFDADGVHLNYEGYKALAEKILECIDNKQLS